MVHTICLYLFCSNIDFTGVLNIIWHLIALMVDSRYILVYLLKHWKGPLLPKANLYTRKLKMAINPRPPTAGVTAAAIVFELSAMFSLLSAPATVDSEDV